MQRPDFLNRHHENGQTIVVAFRQLPKDEAAAVDSWLLWAQYYGSMTWQERCLFDWINEGDDLEAAFGSTF